MDASALVDVSIACWTSSVFAVDSRSSVEEDASAPVAPFHRLGLPGVALVAAAGLV